MSTDIPNSGRPLVERIGRGDSSAEEEFVRAFLPRVLDFVGIRTHDQELAREVGQDVMLAVLCALREGRLRDPDNLPGFVYGTARNQLQDRLRRRAQEKLDPLLPDFDIPHVDPRYEDAEQLERAHQAIDALESVDRRILLMTLVDGLKPQAIARSLGLNGDVVRQRKTRAIRKVTEWIRGTSQTDSNIRLTKERG
jgi:RNA polymerase sigma-70 factor (ECF subfamily)